ncbi:MAG: hypothetical protein R2799_07585 [Crocinitomicaceae bacterium]
MHRLFYIIAVTFFMGSCGNTESRKEFDEMKPDLDAASAMYCECMMNADLHEESNPQECKEILNKMLLSKCGDNEKAQHYVQEAIRKCVESRGELNEEDE